MASANQMRSAFQNIYSTDAWHGGSGPGSTPINTLEYRSFLQRFMCENSVKTVTDLGCGDWQFSHLINWDGISYLGIDLVPGLIEHHQLKYGAPNINFSVFQDIGQLPGGDLLISKEVLQHLPNALILDYVGVIRRKYKWALLTNSVAPGWNGNADISAGGYRPLRLDQPPFNVSGAVVLKYFVQSGDFIFHNHIYLIQGG